MKRAPACTVRASTERDLDSITSIYAYYVLQGTSTFETVPPDVREMARRRSASVSKGLPHLVVELGGTIVAYAYAHAYRDRAAYLLTAEDSIYVDHRFAGAGIGALLLAALVEACEKGPWRQLVAVIGDSANAASIRLHRKFDFREVGTLRSVGLKFGRWVDTVIMQRPLGEADGSVPDDG